MSAESGQDSDYDGAWKDAWQVHLRPLMCHYFPKVAERIDWSVPPVWADKEISQVLAVHQKRNKSVDLLVKVQLRDGESCYLFLHIEIQTSFESNYEARIQLYNQGLSWALQQQVVTLVVLADLNEKWDPSEYRFDLADFHSRTRFPTCKLIHRLKNEWSDDQTLPVLLARAQMEALRTASEPEKRYLAKWELVRGLYNLGYGEKEIRELFRLIDWMMHLRPNLEEQFRHDLHAFEEQQKMPYITSIERLAKKEGLNEGMEKGMEKGIEKGIKKGMKTGMKRGVERGMSKSALLVMAGQFGKLPSDITDMTNRLTLSQLESLMKQIPKALTLHDARQLLTDLLGE